MSDKAIALAYELGWQARMKGEVIANAKRAIARLNMPPASAPHLTEYLRATTPMERHLEKVVMERGVREGTLALRLARQIDKRAVHGQVLRIGGARLTVKDPAQREAAPA